MSCVLSPRRDALVLHMPRDTCCVNSPVVNSEAPERAPTSRAAGAVPCRAELVRGVTCLPISPRQDFSSPYPPHSGLHDCDLRDIERRRGGRGSVTCRDYAGH